MDRRTVALTAALALAGAACGDPVIVLGDAPGFMRIVAGVGDSIGTRVDSLATRTRFTNVAAAAFDDATGVLYIADQGAVVQSGGITKPVGRIFAITSAGRATLLVARGGCIGEVCLERPHDLALDGRGSLLVADLLGHRVFRLDLDGGPLAVVAGTGTPGTSPDGSPAALSPLSSPAGLAVGDDGRIFVAERNGHRVRVIAGDGSIHTVAGTGQPGSTGDGGPATAARLDLPAGLAAGDGVLYIADAGNHRVRAVDLAAGVIRNVAGSGTLGFAGDGGLAAEALLNRPQDVAVTADGVSLFIADSFNHRIRVVNLRTGDITTYAGTGSADFTAASGPAGQLSLDGPAGLATSVSGFLFIVDAGHYAVWRTTIRL
jgi:sugar lactone lactonase YvrE